ncbi:MAG: EAL domain-containing protein [Zoogloeaceae bacterium]|nr:EAL domain-containing protein [Zoogloeaceae bacterium]
MQMQATTPARPLSKRLADLIYTLTAPEWVFSPTLLAIRNGFLLSLPLVVTGALAILLNNLPLPSYQQGMESLFGPNWSRLGGLVWQGTFGILSLPMLIGISYYLTSLHNQHHAKEAVSPIIAALVALASLMVMIPTDNNGIDGFAPYFGTQGLFVSILVALAATRVFLAFAKIPRLQKLIYSEGMEASIPQAFSCLVPGMLTVFLFAGFYLAFQAVVGMSIHQAVHDALLLPFRLEMFRSVLDSGIAYVFLTHLFWFFGIHGSNVLDPMTRELFASAVQANLAAGMPPAIITKPFLDIFVFMGGSGSSICLLAALLFSSRNDGCQRLARVSLLPGLFNINEILLFGLPVILNPVFLLPFLLVPLLLLLTSFLAVYYGMVPMPEAVLDWTTPPILGGYFATHSLSGSLLQVFNLILGTLLYIPFVKISDRVKEERQKKAMRALMTIACSNEVGPSGKKCLDRDDDVGVLARVLASDLERALKKNTGLYLEYQPQVDHHTGKAVGAEALVRWRHPVYGSIPAPIMVAISEDGDFMRPLGLWVLNEACAERARWRQHGVDEHFKTAVNVSIRQLDDITFPQQVVQCLERHQLPHQMIGIEVTESVALDPESLHNQILNQIHNLGFAISIDEFGMGHSSLVYLKYFPVNILKIDKALSQEVASSQTCVEIISTIVELCRALEVKIVVEFVENQEQIEVLLRLGCHIFQGYFYSPPLSGEKMLAYVQDMNGIVDNPP